MDVRCKDTDKNENAPKVSQKTFGAPSLFHPAESGAIVHLLIH